MNLLKNARPFLSDQITITRRGGLPLLKGLGFEPGQPDNPMLIPNLSGGPKTKKELRRMVD